LNPRQDDTTKLQAAVVRFKVRSESPLRVLELQRYDRTLSSIDPGKLKQDSEGYFQLEIPVMWESGANPLQVVAVNDGGRQQSSVTVTYIPEPLRLVIDRLESREHPGQFFTQTQLQDNCLTLPAVPDGLLRLHGRVVWTDAKDQQLRKQARILVRVNGFLQPCPELPEARPNSLERPFQVDLMLNQPVNNRIKIEIPPLPLGETSVREVLVETCAHPITAQRLHLLIVGISQKDPKKLVDQALAAFQAIPHASGQKDLFACQVFKEVRIYGPLVVDVRRGQVFSQLVSIGEKIKAWARLSPAVRLNDVVVVYYQGEELIKGNVPYFLTDYSYRVPDMAQEAIQFQDLPTHFAHTPGAQVFLLDVTRQDRPLGPGDVKPPRDSVVGVFRYTWHGGANVPAPEDARLIAHLQRVLPDTGNLSELKQKISGTYSQVSLKYQNKLFFADYLPPDLNDVLVGGKP
jgi:hypothetical protein